MVNPCYINLTQGLVAIVDEEDYQRLSAFKWYAHRRNDGNAFYATRHSYKHGKQSTILMHREVLCAEKGQMVDHIDTYQTLDNRKANLRFVDLRQNQANRRKQRNNTSGFKNVYWRADRKRWVVFLSVDGNQKYIKSFKNFDDAVEACKKATRQHNGDYARCQ